MQQYFIRTYRIERLLLTLSHEEIPEQKRQLRQIYLQRRLQIPAEAYHDASLQLESCYAPISNKTPGKVLAGYLPMRGEIDILPIFKHFSLNNYTCCLPVVTSSGEALSFRAWKPGEPLEAGQFGVKVPLSDAPVVTPDVILLPLIAYDTLGYRLGYGGGYYDRTLRALRNKGHRFLAIGAAFSVQQIKLLPREKQDEKLDAVITETGMVWF